jgi:CRISPR-associated protein Csd1
MLNLLLDYAQRNQLVTEPGFAPKTIKWLIWLGSDGDLLDVIELGDPSQKNNPGQEFNWCPDMEQDELIAGGKTRSQFLWETCDVVATYRVEGDTKKLAKHDYFVSLLQQAAQEKGLDSVAAAAKALQNPQVLETICQRLDALKAKPTDKITLKVGETTLLENPTLRDWWRRHRLQTSPKAQSKMAPMVCFATGEVVSPLETHPKVKGGLVDVGGQASGSVLIGFDKDAFTSYGLKQSANCAVSTNAAYAYRSALYDLLTKRSRVIAGAKITYWFSHAVKPEDDPIAMLIGETGEQQEATAQAQVRRLLESIQTGQRPDLTDNRFYALTLSGSGGRVMVRDWAESDFKTLAENIDCWFDDLSIVHRDGGRLADPPRFLAVVGALAREMKDVPPPLTARLFHSALTRTPLPGEVLARALQRVRVDIIENNPFNHARMGILKATLIRKGGYHMQPYLNPQHPSPAYHCGRLLAVLANLQRTALPSVEAGVVQRFYAAASATPALVLGRILRTAQFHLDKVRADSPGLAAWYEGKIAEIMGALKDNIPATLSLEEQSLFALGYYQQLAQDRAGKSATDTNTSPQEEAQP